MAITEAKSTHSQQHQTAESASLTSEQDHAFFSEQATEMSPFFQAGAAPAVQAQLGHHQPTFFQPASASSIQLKCTACDAEEKSPTLQPVPAFESEADELVQAKAQLQRMPAFESEIEADVQPKPFIQKQAEPEAEPEEESSVEADLHPKLATNPVAPPEDAGDGQSDSQPFVQTKLTMGQPGDRYEREADAMADQVTSSSGRKTDGVQTLASAEQQHAIQRLEALLQRAESRKTSSSTPAHLESRLQGAKGGGAPLDMQTKADMESGFGADFSGVRVHTGSESASLNQSIQSRAFTHGNDIFFNSGEYQPQTEGGKHLMAHELTHTLQQGASVQRKPAISSTNHDVQAFLPDYITDTVNDYAQNIPGYRLITVAIGFNPLTGEDIERTATNWIEELMKLVPFGTVIYKKLKQYQILQDAFQWVEGELDRLDLSITQLENTIEAAWDEMDFKRLDPFDYNVAVLKRHLDRLYRDVKQFALSLKNKFIELIKEAAIKYIEPLLADNEAWSLLKKILRYDPLRGEEVKATTVEILEDFLLLIGREQELAKMKEEGTLQRTANWLDTQLGTFEDLQGQLKKIFNSVIDAIKPSNLTNLNTNLIKISKQVDSFLGQVWDFAQTVAAKVLEFIKDALLSELKSYVSDQTPAYPLLTVILGKDPFTQEPVPRTPTNLIKGFMSLMPGGTEQFNRLQETGVIPKAAARIESKISELGITWPFVRGLFLNIWQSLTIEDLLTPIETFIRVLNQFREPLNRLFTFVIEVIKVVLELVLELMNFPSDLLANIINNAMQALDDIKRDPVGFLINMLETVKLGFSNFLDNILQHLGEGLQTWFFMQLEKAGIQPPPDTSLESILDLVLQILGITMEKIWSKLADRIGQEKVDRIRGAIDQLQGIWTFVRDVQEQGISAIWEYIESQITNLWDTILTQAQEWIMTQVIERVTTKLLSMLDPTGVMAVVNSFIALFNAIESAVQYFREILEIINDWVSTLASVAEGELKPGAQKLEAGLASSIPVAISFLANQVGLSNLGTKIEEILADVRNLVDQALDWLVDRAVSLGQGFLNRLGAGTEETKTPRGADGGVIGEVEEWSVGQEDHQMWINATTLEVMMASEKGRSVSWALDRYSGYAEERDIDIDDKIKSANDTNKRVKALAQEEHEIATQEDPDPDKLEEKENELEEAQDLLSEKVRAIQVALDLDSEADFKEDLEKARSYFERSPFSRQDLEDLFDISDSAAGKRITNWKSLGLLFVNSSASSDRFTRYSFDPLFGGYRPTDGDNRTRYGYINPSKTSTKGMIILSKGLRRDISPKPIEKDKPSYHENSAVYKSMRPASDYEKFGFDVAILGHKKPAVEHWNEIGHTWPRSKILEWNKDPDNYWGPEHQAESRAEGGRMTEFYEPPTRQRGSHESWWS